jgi:hypothetical protein
MVKAALASMLIVLLTCSVQAGIIQNEAPAPAPPPPVRTAQEPTDATVEPNANGDVQKEVPSDLTQVVLELLAVLPSLL